MHILKGKRIAAVLIAGAFLLTGCGQKGTPSQISEPVSEKENAEISATVEQEDAEEVKSFYAPEGFSEQDWSGDFDISKCYITNKVTGLNRFYIDENHVLWGCGRNEYGQLGLNRPEDTDTGQYYEDYQKIAEHVVHVDCSVNGYFMVYLTENGDLYGVGDNMDGLMMNDVSEDPEYDIYTMNPGENIQYTPKLLMSDVSYVSAGMYSLSVLKNSGDVYWWGRTYGINRIDVAEEPMVYTTPHLMVENAKYVSSGDTTMAAITNDNELYTWGNNFWGQCGIESEDYCIEEAQKVADGVSMVWAEKMVLNDVADHWSPYWEMNYEYNYDNLFILKDDGKMYACGKNMGTKQRTLEVSAEDSGAPDDQEIKGQYGVEFYPIQIEEATFVPKEG